MRLLLIRHGETAHNRGQVTLGRADVLLTPRGMLQARAIAASFTRPPDAIVHSPLERAATIARMIGAATGVTPEADDGLIEMDVGEMEHLSYVELRDLYPDFLRLWLGDGAGDAQMPGGESLADVQARSWAVVERMRAKWPDGTVAAVAHNFVILALLCGALDVPLSSFRRFRIALGGISVLDLGERGNTLLQLNGLTHLTAAGLADDLSGR
jgi:broad specificity phosphatase PhoE